MYIQITEIRQTSVVVWHWKKLHTVVCGSKISYKTTTLHTN